MGNSVVIDLQHIASDTSSNILELLRKSLVVASKLNLVDFKKWINSELNGYTDSELSTYRILKAQVMAKSPFHGLIPFVINHQDIEEKISEVEIREPISSLINLVENHSAVGYFEFPFPGDLQTLLMKIQSPGQALPLIRVIGPNQISSIIDKVKTKVLEWSLLLEAEGILGENLIFSDIEKDRAKKSMNINIQNFQGILGDVSGGKVSQNNSQNVLNDNFDSLFSYLSSYGIDKGSLLELKAAIEEDKEGHFNQNVRFGVKVSEWIGKMISKAADGSWQIGIGVASGILVEALNQYYGIGS